MDWDKVKDVGYWNTMLSGNSSFWFREVEDGVSHHWKPVFNSVTVAGARRLASRHRNSACSTLEVTVYYKPPMLEAYDIPFVPDDVRVLCRKVGRSKWTYVG